MLTTLIIINIVGDLTSGLLSPNEVNLRCKLDDLDFDEESVNVNLTLFRMCENEINRKKLLTDKSFIFPETMNRFVEVRPIR